MRLSQTADIEAPVETVWAFLMDVPRMASCIPGMESVQALDDDTYRGLLRVRIGPIALAFRGKIVVVRRDEPGHTLAVRGEAVDERAAGAVRTEARMTLTADESGEPRTRLHVESEATIMGRIGEFGQPVIRRKADQLLSEFASRAQKAIQASPDPAASP
jgi:carbon monoxide dehydrogenase subunit G